MALTNLYGVNYKKALVTVPPLKIKQGELGGKKRLLIDSFALDADAAGTEVVIMGRLPKNALVVRARVFGPDLGGTGTLKLGNSVSVDGSGTDAVDDDSFITAADSSGQAFDVSDNATAAMRGAAIGKVRFSTEVNLTLTFSGATSGATAAVVYTIVEYIID